MLGAGAPCTVCAAVARPPKMGIGRSRPADTSHPDQTTRLSSSGISRQDLEDGGDGGDDGDAMQVEAQQAGGASATPLPLSAAATQMSDPSAATPRPSLWG